MCRDRILAKNFRPLRSLRLETGGKFNLPIFHFWDLAVQRMWWTLKDYGELNIFGVSNNLISINQHLSIIDTFWKIESESGTLFRFNEIDKQGFEFFFRRKKNRKLLILRTKDIIEFRPASISQPSCVSDTQGSFVYRKSSVSEYFLIWRKRRHQFSRHQQMLVGWQSAAIWFDLENCREQKKTS